MIGSDSDIIFEKKQVSQIKLLPKSSIGHQSLKCSQACQIFITKTDKKNDEPYSRKENFLTGNFSLRYGEWKADKPAKRTSEITEETSLGVSKKMFD